MNWDKVQKLEAQSLEALLVALRKRGYRLLGPTVGEGAIVYDEIEEIGDLPRGWTDNQEAGRYRLQRRDDEAFFGFVPGPQSPKRYLFPSELKLWESKKTEEGWEVTKRDEGEGKMAFLGVRSCELHAIKIQDRVFLEGDYVHEPYRKRREDLFLVALNCTEAGGTCFCVSMNTGPEVSLPCDLFLTEVLEEESHYFLLSAGSERGEDILKELPSQKAAREEIDLARKKIAQTAQNMGRAMDTTDIQGLFARHRESGQWAEVATRCLTCANCTLVCPTCFCQTIEDSTDLTGEISQRWMKWDSCFHLDFSYLHGGSVRSATSSRYRQWISHKLATWIDQFGTSGCVGCGRCITWCPVGIDITEEVKRLRSRED